MLHSAAFNTTSAFASGIVLKYIVLCHIILRLWVRSFGQNPNPDFESKNGFSIPLGRSKKEFRIH